MSRRVCGFQALSLCVVSSEIKGEQVSGESACKKAVGVEAESSVGNGSRGRQQWGQWE